MERGFRFAKNGEEIEVSVAKEELAPPALAEAPQLIEREGTAPVGYLHLRQFIDAALDPAEGFSSLSEAATVFANNDVTDLVIDLRYNGGGLLRVADTMMDLLAGRTARGAPSFKIQVNDQHPDYNDDEATGGSLMSCQTRSRRVALLLLPPAQRPPPANSSSMVLIRTSTW